jgi:hypothetical protein
MCIKSYFENNFFIDCEITSKVQKRQLTMPLTNFAHIVIFHFIIDQTRITRLITAKVVVHKGVQKGVRLSVATYDNEDNILAF